MNIDGNYLVFSSGRRLYAFAAIIGLDLRDPAGPESITGGYDDRFPGGDDQLTLVERRELADHMIAAWSAYRDAPDG